MTNETLMTIANISLNTALETMAKKANISTDQVRQAILNGEKHANETFRELSDATYLAIESIGIN